MDAFDWEVNAEWDVLYWLIGKRRWWMVLLAAVVVYGLIEKLVIPKLQGYITFGEKLGEWRPDLEALQIGFITFPAIFAFYVWSGSGARGSIPSLFESLHQCGVFKGDGYLRFLADSKQRRWWFSRGKWTLVSWAFSIALTCFIGFYLWARDIPVEIWFKDGGNAAWAIALVLLASALYAAGHILIREALLAWTLHKLWKNRDADLVLHSKRDDSAGLGQLAVHFKWLLVLVTLVFIAFTMASVLPALRGDEAEPWWQVALMDAAGVETVSTRQGFGDFAVFIVAMWAIYVALWGLFAYLVWPAHCAMKCERDKRLGEIADRINETTIRIEEAVRKGRFDEMSSNGDQTSFDDDLGDLESLRKLHGWLDDDLTTWPVSRAWRQIRLSALIPLVATVIATVTSLSDYFQSS